ncbi:hypothetical protein NL676_019163 [Syzygium grande]|nr:hypothetical protein NL676_019163 [Syzygium grande]
MEMRVWRMMRSASQMVLEMLREEHDIIWSLRRRSSWSVGGCSFVVGSNVAEIDHGRSKSLRPVAPPLHSRCPTVTPTLPDAHHLAATIVPRKPFSLLPLPELLWLPHRSPPTTAAT